MKKILMISLTISLLLMNHGSWAKQSWQKWVNDLRVEAIEQGIDPGLFDEVFSGLTPNQQVLRFDRTQPEKRLTFTKYRNTRADSYRIQLGQKKYKKYRKLLEKVGKDFDVDPCFITSLWGLETSYGHYMGNFPVIKSLATLAYDSRRSQFFRQELLYALEILNDGHVTQDKFKGEWAGASGHPQFLPSSWHNFAVDYTGDGRRDIWTSHADAFASIANYLKQNGWQSGQPWAIQVKLPAKFDKRLEGKDKTKQVSEWDELGVRLMDGDHLPYQNLSAAIVVPHGGPAFLAFENFKVIMSYNNSIYYAGTVGYMADKICRR
ncbi:MAG: lytic murein transglycosylase [Legionellales bacterium]|nr:lytic murein transglycosylase [Legionellales bacterium]